MNKLMSDQHELFSSIAQKPLAAHIDTYADSTFNDLHASLIDDGTDVDY